MWTILRLAVLGLTVLASTARADDWVSPTTRTLVSPDGRIEAVITPAPNGTSRARATVGEKGRPGKSFTLATPWMPVDVVLFDDGSLLALDDWGALGYGKVATVYERGGAVRWSKTLVDMLGQPFVDSAPHSVSSIWWRTTPLEWSLAKGGKSGAITLFDENQLQLVLRDGNAKLVSVANLPNEPQRLLNRARAQVENGQHAAAIALLERVLDKDPDLLEAVLLYVEALQHGNDHARAVSALEHVSARWKAGTDGTSLANVYIAWAASLTSLTRGKDAERVLRLGVVAAPVYTTPTIALAKLLVDQGRVKEANLVLDDFVGRLLQAPSLDDYALLDIADFYKARGDLAKALASYLKAYKKDQVTNQFLYANLALLYEQMGNVAEAVRIDEQLLAHFVKMGSAFDMYTTKTRADLSRLRAKKGS